MLHTHGPTHGTPAHEHLEYHAQQGNISADDYVSSCHLRGSEGGGGGGEGGGGEEVGRKGEREGRGREGKRGRGEEGRGKNIRVVSTPK